MFLYALPAVRLYPLVLFGSVVRSRLIELFDSVLFGSVRISSVLISAIVIGSLMWCAVTPRVAHAEMLGSALARSADPGRQPAVSVEVSGNWYTRQMHWYGLRFNFTPSNAVSVYVDLAHTKLLGLPVSRQQHVNVAGNGFGFGVLVPIQDKLNSIDLAIRATHHELELTDFAASSFPMANVSQAALQRFRTRQSIIDVLMSPIDPIFENGVFWYATLGYVSTRSVSNAPNATFSSNARYQDKTGLAAGLGLVMPRGRFELLAGVEILARDPLLTLGFRFPLR